MKNVLVISVLLAFLLPAPKANAYTIGSVGVSETGGISVSNEVEAFGSSEADASVRSIIRSDSSNTRVRIDIQTRSDGVEHATSVSRTIQRGERVEVRIGTSSAGVEVQTEGSDGLETPVAPGLPFPVFERLSNLLERIFNILFFFW